MPKQVTCGLCQEDFPRARALRRHLALSRCSAQRRRLPAPGVMAPEAWETEPLCSVSPPPDAADNLGPIDRTVASSPPLDVASPSSAPPGIATDGPETPPTLKLLMSELASEADPVAQQSPPAPAALPRRQVSVAVQADGDWFPVDRARRRIFGDCRRPRGRIPVHLRHQRDGQHNEADSNPYVDEAERRRTCDCSVCIDHVLQVAAAPGGLFALAPRATGLKMVALPGITTETASLPTRQHLVRLLTDHPDKTWVVCGCAVCTTHWNLLRAWLRAVAVQPDVTLPARPRSDRRLHGTSSLPLPHRHR